MASVNKQRPKRKKLTTSPCWPTFATFSPGPAAAGSLPGNWWRVCTLCLSGGGVLRTARSAFGASMALSASPALWHLAAQHADRRPRGERVRDVGVCGIEAGRKQKVESRERKSENRAPE